jgi:hypothetical protein
VTPATLTRIRAQAPAVASGGPKALFPPKQIVTFDGEVLPYRTFIAAGLASVSASFVANPI